MFALITSACPYRRVSASDGVALDQLSDSMLNCGAALDGLGMLPDRGVP